MVKMGGSSVLTHAIVLKIGQYQLSLFNITLQIRQESLPKNNFQSTVTKKVGIIP
jgi:hypothetical protein